MKKTFVFIIFLIMFISGCAKMPKEAIELSTTVGRDISVIKKSHLSLIDLYYKSLIKDINVFIDTVYLPYTVKRTLSDDIWKKEMLLAIENASKSDTTKNQTLESYEKIEMFLLIIQEEVESYRKLKLKPIEEQYMLTRHNILKSYEQVHYANSIVTGHLASVAKVHDSQSEILEKLDLKDLRLKVANNVSSMSEKIDDLTLKAKKGNEKISTIIKKFEEVVNR